MMRWRRQLVLAAAAVLAALSTVGYSSEARNLTSDREVAREESQRRISPWVVPGLEEPLVAAGQPSLEDTAALEAAVSAYLAAPPTGDIAALQRYVSEHPDSVWRVSVLLNLGIAYYREGYFSRAIQAWREAWVDGQELDEPLPKALADRAVGELARMHARLGRSDELTALIQEIGDRPIGGSATEMITGAREALWLFANEPERSFLCGPLALKNVLLAIESDAESIASMDAQRSGPRGFDLEQLGQLAEAVDLDYRLVFRAPGEPVPVPSVVNWKLNHYAAIVSEDDGRFLVKDPTFASGDAWMTQQAIDEEASGYFLVPAVVSDDDSWRDVPLVEARQVYGMGVTTESQFGATTRDDVNLNGDPGCGMCVVDAKTMLVSLTLRDTPVGYNPPIGPSPHVQLTYNQREAGHPAVFGRFNVSPKWSMNVKSWIREEDPSPGQGVTRHVGGGGYVDYRAGYIFDTETGEFSPERQSQSVLIRMPATGPATSYELRQPDGSKEVYAEAESEGMYPRRLFLSEIVDAQGNSLQLDYERTVDDALRLVSLTDATGRATTISYELADSPLLVTRITDPFGRDAELTYDDDGRLSSITDVIDLTSEFSYDEDGLINAMETPYGTHTFDYGGGDTTENYRYLEMTDPLGFTERLEFRHAAPGILPNESTDAVPQDVPVQNVFLNYRNTYHWDKQTYPAASTDYTQARVTHWLHNPWRQTSPIIESTKEPLEGRVWRTYPGQSGSYYALFEGTAGTPSTISRVLDDGTTQTNRFTYNRFGNPLTTVDPLGRETRLTYADNGIDVVQIERRIGDDEYETLATLTYSDSHLPLTYTDAAGQISIFTYNDAGQLTSRTDPLGERTAYEYGPLGYLLRIIDANGDTTVTFDYDAFGRVSSRTDSEGYTVTFEYDAMDRVVRAAFPGGTAYEYEWDRLDLASMTDRLGRTTRYTYDAGRRLVSITDALGQSTDLDYDPNGALIGLTDAKGQKTTWERDLQGRVTAKVYADGTTTQLAYEPSTSRLQSTTDALGQVKSFLYAIDDRVTGIEYANAGSPTPNVAFSWDEHYPRLVSMSDGTGTTSYEYGAVGEFGANQLAAVTSPVAGQPGLTDTIRYGYDALGREIERAFGGSTETRDFDPIGRLASVENPLGSFDYSYAGATSRVVGIDASRGPNLDLTYYGSERDQLLRAMTYTTQDGTELAKFGYRYDAGHNVIEFTQGYADQARDVVSLAPLERSPIAELGGDGSAAEILKASVGSASSTKLAVVALVGMIAAGLALLVHSRHVFLRRTSYLSQACAFLLLTAFSLLLVAACSNDDDNGEVDTPPVVDDGFGETALVSAYAYDPLDRLESVVLSNFGDELGEPSYRYDYDPASNITRIETPDTESDIAHTATNTIVGGDYDANGSPTSLDGATYEWDAENRLVRWVSAGKESRFSYDGQSRLIRIVDREADAVVRDRSYTWCGLLRCVERNNLQAGSPVSKVYLGQGSANDGVATYHIADLLGSARRIVEGDGSVIAQYDYDAYGTEAVASGSIDGEKGYAMLFRHAASDLYFGVYRAYDPSAGRWLSRDPIGETGGLNLYAYGDMNPVSFIDPLGLDPWLNPFESPIHERIYEEPNSATAAYNCISLAFGDGTRWDNDIRDDLEHYEPIPWGEDVNVGDVLVYIGDLPDTLRYKWLGIGDRSFHASTVTSVTDGKVTEVESKFGGGVRGTHHPGKRQVTDYYGGFRVYYRKKEIDLGGRLHP